MFLRISDLLQTKQWSIADKLTFLYTITTASILTIIAILLYWALNNLMVTAEKQYLIDEAHVIQDILRRNPTDILAVRQEVNGVPASVKDASYHYYVKLLDDQHRVIMQTPKSGDILSQLHFPGFQLNQWWKNFIFTQSSANRPFLLMSSPVGFNQAGSPDVFMQIALDISYPQQLIKNYRNKIMLFLLFSIITVMVLGRVIAKAGLSRLNELVDLTEHITASRLSQRINPEEWPKELKALGIAFNQMLAGIEKAFAKLNQCTTELAHELKTPMNNLLGTTEICLSRARSQDEYRCVLESNYEEGRRIAKLIENVLFLARAEDPQTLLVTEEVDISKEILKIAEYYEITCLDKKIEFTCKVDGKLKVEPTLFRRAITNVLSNAIRYTPVGGKINIKSIRHDNAAMGIIISDSGIGISSEHIVNILQPFYRVNHADNFQSCGIGLGLAIVKSIMDLHGGEITIQSQPNLGTIVALNFPVI